MAREDLQTDFAVGAPVRKTWMNQIGTNDADHEARTLDLETSAADHESRIDLLEANGPAADRQFVLTTVISDSQIKTLPTTPIALVTPALNTRVKFLSVTYFTAFEHGVYGNVDATYAALAIQLSAADWLGGVIVNESVSAIVKLTTMLTTAARRTIDVGAYQEVSGSGWLQPYVSTPTTTVDAGIVYLAADNNGAGNWTGGHVSNNLTLVMRYALEDVPAGIPFGQPFHNEYRAMRRRPRRGRVNQAAFASNALVP